MLASGPITELSRHRILHHNDSQSAAWKHESLVPSPKLASKFNSLLSHYNNQLSTLPRNNTEASSPTANGPLKTGEDRESSSGPCSTSSLSSSSSYSAEPRSIGCTSANSGNGGGACSVDRRMNTNGLDRSAMTGSTTTTSESIPWLSDSAVASQSRSRSTGSTIHTTASSSHDPGHLMSASSSAAAVGPSSLFRPPPPHTERSFSGQYHGLAYTTSGTTLPYSPSFYNPSHLPSQLSLSSYQYYTGYPSYTNPSLISPGPYPSPLDTPQSYSEMLERFNIVAQRVHQQSQLPRASFIPGHLPHPYGLTPTTSPGPSIPRPLTSMEPQRHNSKSPKLESGRSSPKEAGKSSLHIQPPHPSHHHLHSHRVKFHHTSTLKSDPSATESGSRESGYKVPIPPGTSKEDTHRFLRPPDTHGSGFTEFKFPHQLKHEDSPSKRHKGRFASYPHAEHYQPSTSQGSLPGISGGPPLPPLPPASAGYPTQPHYPPHFMKGSIIQLANGDFKRVEDLRTDDFVHSADISGDLKIDSSTVVRIEENRDRGTALLGFSVGENRIQVSM